jgi:ankyrin repeat domain-containing protein 17
LVTVLLAINANVEDKGHKNETTPLMEACANGHKQIVQLLLKHNANINAQSARGNTPLHYAIQHNYTEIVEILIKHGGSNLKLELANDNGHTPLMEAASNGHVECSRLLIDAGADVNTHSSEFKETALTLASYKGQVDMVKFLLERNADLEHKTDEMHTALMEACMDGHVEVARILIEHGSNVNMPPDSFESPLTLAACGGHVELANLLIDHHADLEERNDEGYTPLMEAAREGHEEMVALLLFHDADINAITEETQETALTLACCGGCYEVAKFLLEAGADPNLGNASTPLMEAAQEGHLELVQLLIRSGAEINKFTSTVTSSNNNNSNNNNNQNNSSTTNTAAATPTITSCESALTLAAENGHTDVVDVLIKSGAEVDQADPEKGFTPLMKASRAGQSCTVQYLLTNYANPTNGTPLIDVNKTTLNNEFTALSLACQNSHLQIVELLLQYGANPLLPLKDNSNCLIEASKGGHIKIVELLIDWNYSLNINTTNNNLNKINIDSSLNNNEKSFNEDLSFECCQYDDVEVNKRFNYLLLF